MCFKCVSNVVHVSVSVCVQVFIRCVLSVFQVFFKYTSKWVSSGLQVCFRCVSSVFQESFKCVSSVFQVSLKCVSSVSQVCLKCVSSVFQLCLNVRLSVCFSVF